MTGPTNITHVASHAKSLEIIAIHVSLLILTNAESNRGFLKLTE